MARKKKNDFTLQNKLNEMLSHPIAIALICIIFSTLLIMIVNFFFYSFLDLVYLLKRKIAMKDIVLLKNFTTFKFQKYPKYYLFLACALAIFNISLAFRMRINFSPIKLQGQKGNREWTTIKELQKQYKAVPEKGRFRGRGGIVISRYGENIYIDDTAVNNLIIGTTRSGKGELTLIPTIDVYSRAEYQASMVTNDPKGEHAASGYETLKKRGYDVYVLNLIDLKRSMSYNPLQLIIEEYRSGDVDGAQLQARTFSTMLFYDPHAKDTVWQNWSISLTNALILAHVIDCCKTGDYEKINMYSVARTLATYATIQVNAKSTALDVFFLQRDEDDIARLQYAAVLAADVRTKGNIYANTLSKLELFTYSNTARFTSKNDLNLIDVGYGEKPVAVFLCVPDYDSSLNFMASLFIKQLYYKLAREAANHEGNCCKRQVAVLLDEAGNMNPLPDFATMVTVANSRNIYFTIAIQAYSQLENKYGKNNAKTIIGNCGNQIYILTNEENTARHFSSLIGNETIVSVSRSGKSVFSINKSRNEQTEGRPLLTYTELMELLPGETVVVRVIKRRDNKGRPVKPKPIYNTGVTCLKHRFEYINEEFDTTKSLLQCPIECRHNDVQLKNIVYPIFKELPKPEMETAAENLKQDIPLCDVLSKQQLAALQSLIPDIEIDIESSTKEEMLEMFDNLYEGEGIDEAKYKAAKRILNGVNLP